MLACCSASRSRPACSDPLTRRRSTAWAPSSARARPSFRSWRQFQKTRISRTRPSFATNSQDNAFGIIPFRSSLSINGLVAGLTGGLKRTVSRVSAWMRPSGIRKPCGLPTRAGALTAIHRGACKWPAPSTCSSRGTVAIMVGPTAEPRRVPTVFPRMPGRGLRWCAAPGSTSRAARDGRGPGSGSRYCRRR